jgi:hypothetical protein
MEKIVTNTPRVELLLKLLAECCEGREAEVDAAQDMTPAEIQDRLHELVNRVEPATDEEFAVVAYATMKGIKSGKLELLSVQ